MYDCQGSNILQTSRLFPPASTDRSSLLSSCLWTRSLEEMDISDIVQQTQAATYVIWCALSLWSWDWALALAEEYETVKICGRSCAMLAYVIARISTGILCVFVLVFYMGTLNNDCNAFLGIGISLTIGTAAKSWLFLMRVRAIYSNSKLVTVIAGVGWLGVVARARTYRVLCYFWYCINPRHCTVVELGIRYLYLYRDFRQANQLHDIKYQFQESHLVAPSKRCRKRRYYIALPTATATPMTLTNLIGQSSEYRTRFQYSGWTVVCIWYTIASDLNESEQATDTNFRVAAFELPAAPTHTEVTTVFVQH
ncbi:hypothetical protein FIBSPDRAFT_926077 [Athelia psychrophila]|uniref:Transmembrane protein n=1 Tax=Athelia psychrophila TaxID=1759441 RepID=A0A166TSY2_9AGAM|nr:hypothetical protein FIBSPDRAFT_926077 [Fibularhizoctonia sp. CBS 109695]